MRAQPEVRQMPRGAMRREPEYAAPAYAEATYGAPPYSAQAYAAPSAPALSPAPVSAPRPAPVAARPKPAPKAPPPPEPEMEEEEVPSDEELDKMLGPTRDTAKAFAAPVRDETTELDEEAIEKLPDPDPVRQFADDDDVDLDDDIEPEDIPDPDPIPEVYGGADDVDDYEDEDEDEESGGFSMKKLIAPTVAIVALGAIAGGIVVGRETVVGMWPGANEMFYDLVGLHVMVPGDGLKREVIGTAIETVANVDHVIATTRVTNVSDKEQMVPTIMVQLVDAKIQVLEEQEMKIGKEKLQPGETVEFKTTFVGAPVTARAVQTLWGRYSEMAEK